MGKNIKVATVQAEPVWLDLQGSVNKVIDLIQQASSKGANVLGFPQLFVPGYPWSIWTEATLGNASNKMKFLNNSLARESPEMDKIRKAVKDAGIMVVLGYSERDGHSLYQAQSFIDVNGEIVNHRRKIKPTHVERSIFGEGHSESLQNVVSTDFGKIGGLICWEHMKPLLRYYEYTQGVQVHVASYPSAWETAKESPVYSMTAAASQAACQMMAMEGGTFVLLATPIISDANREKAGMANAPDGKVPFAGYSQIFGPDGSPLAKPLGPKEEGILYADIDLADIAPAKHFLDISGHHTRPDLLSLKVKSSAVQHVHHE
ncbi:nitrilase [Physcia stellaris]|nr:nitrilase [Physcia stellaris]